jgi:POT family proton-dependent oligopeptide transporter
MHRIVKELIQPFIDLIHAPRALFAINLTTLLDGMAYFGVLTLLALFLNNSIGLNDILAGRTVGILTAGITLSMVIFGAAVDWIGVRRAIVAALVCMCIGRLVMAGAPSLGGAGPWHAAHWFVLLGIFGIIIGNGIYQPACYAGVKLFTNTKTAAMGYAMLYGVMNLGGFLPGLISPPLRHAAGIRGVLWFYGAVTALEIVLMMFLLSRAAVSRAMRDAKEAGLQKTGDSAAKKDGLEGKPFGEKASYYIRHFPLTDLRFLFFIFILIPVQTLFAHNWLTIPQYTSRAFEGIVSRNFEFFSNLNPILIFLLTPLVTAFTSKRHTYSMMIAGTLIMALPPFFLAFGPRVDTLIAYLVVMSIGEAMWSPRFLQWVAEIAPKNMTGIYMGIGQFPWFLTKMITSLYSGWFLMRYCPAGTPAAHLHTGTMWLVYGVIAVATPLGLLLARTWMMKGFRSDYS